MTIREIQKESELLHRHVRGFIPLPKTPCPSCGGVLSVGIVQPATEWLDCPTCGWDQGDGWNAPGEEWNHVK